MEKLLWVLVLGPAVLLAGIAVIFIVDLVMAWPLMYAWNFVIPGLFKLPVISYWQAFALLIVSSLLIKSHVTNSKS